jgi:methyl-accepting chemotaxis protein
MATRMAAKTRPSRSSASSIFQVVTECLDRLAVGDIPEKVHLSAEGEEGRILVALNGLIDTLNGLIQGAATMAEAAAAGRLDVRLDENRYRGAWREIAAGLNRTAEHMVKPLREVDAVLKRFADGDLKARVSSQYKGDFGELAEAANTLGKQLQGVQEVLGQIHKAVEEGRLDYRGDSRGFRGEIAEMVDQTNAIVEAFMRPFKRVAEGIIQLSQGVIPPPIEDQYTGDFNQLKSAMNGLVSVLKSLLKAEDGPAAVLHAMAQQDFSRTVTAEYVGEFNLMKESVNKVVFNMREALRELIDSANQFAEGARLIAESSQTLADGAQRQASGVQEITASVEQLARSVQAVRDAAAEADQVAKETSRLATEGGEAVRESIEGMEMIKASSEKISEILQVISEIAGQTNLLALNAAIEAARAGEHGLGFAVVADEVRKLAERSNQAAREISALIKESSQRVAHGAALSERTAQALQKILAGVETSVRKVSEIAQATAEQAAGAEQVAQAIQEIAKITDQNAAGAEELASSSEELGAQAASLRSLVGRFRTE